MTRRESPGATPRDDSLRDRIRANLGGPRVADFDALVAWEDEMLAFANDVAARLDRTTEALRGYAAAYHRALYIGRHHEWELRVTDAVRDAAKEALRGTQ